MIHHAQMHGASHVARPEIEIPERPNVQSVPARAEQGGGSISVIAQDEPPPVQRDVSVGLGVSRLFDNIEGKFLARDKLSHPLPDHDPIAEHALPIRSDEVASVGGLCRIRETQAENPVVGPIWNIRKGQATLNPNARSRASSGAVWASPSWSRLPRRRWRARPTTDTTRTITVPKGECCLSLVMPLGARAVALGRTVVADSGGGGAALKPRRDRGASSGTAGFYFRQLPSDTKFLGLAFVAPPRRYGTFALTYTLFDLGTFTKTNKFGEDIGTTYSQMRSCSAQRSPRGSRRSSRRG